jgi:predicted dehydrogenase
MAISCLRRDVNVLLEKPVATTVADGAAVVQAAHDSAAQLGVCFQNRYNVTSAAIRSLLDGGSLGKLLGGRASVTWYRDGAYYRRRPWRGTWAQGGGGVLINQAIHTLDLLQWFLGAPQEVHGQASRLWLRGDIEVEDTAAIQMSHAGGARSVFYATNGYATNAPVQLELLTENATLRLDTDLTVSYRDGRSSVTKETILGAGEHSYWGAAHGALIADFYRHLRDRMPFWIDAGEAMDTLRIVTAVYDQSPQLQEVR